MTMKDIDINNKSTILIVGPTPPPMGGIASYVENMLKSDLVKEYDILHLNTARSFTIKKSSLKNLILTSKNFLKLVYLLLFYKPKIVHIHTSSYSAFWEKSIFLIISKLFAKKVIFHVHGGGFKNFYQSNGLFIRSLIRFFLNISDIIIVLSNVWKEFFLQIIEAEKIRAIPNAVDSSFYEIDRTKNLVNHPYIQILFAGYLSTDKGIYDILDSIPLVIKKHKDVKFLFAGADDKPGELEIIKKKIIDNNIGEYVSFLGILSKKEMSSIYKKSDIFILPSYIEGMPMTILEAMAAGLPVISTPVGGIPEVVEDCVNGFLVIPGDSKNLGDKIIELIENKELRNIIGNNNRKKIKERYDWNIIEQKLEVVYNELLE